MGMFIVPFVITVEIVGDETKTLWGNLIQVPFAIGEALVSTIAIGVHEYKTFLLVTSVPFFALLLLWFVLPESPRWLIATGRHKQAKAVIEKAAKINKVRQSRTL